MEDIQGGAYLCSPGPMYPGSYVPHFVCDQRTKDPASESFFRRMVGASPAFFASDSPVIG